MSALHLVNRFSADGALTARLATVADGDAVLFYESGVLNCCLGSIDRRRSAPRARFLAMRLDVAAHGIAERLDRAIEVIDDLDFVDLVASHRPIVSWT